MSQKRILIIDDDPDITETMKIVLENAGHEISVAQNGTQGMEKVKADKPDLIILDVMMDEAREGFFLSRELKKDSESKDIPILMVTSVKEKTGIDFKSAAGDEEWLPVEEFLDKPVEPKVLIEKVEALLQNS